MASTNIQTFPGKVGVSNTNPIHTLDIGSNVYIDDTAQTKLRIIGNIHASGVTVDGTITAIDSENLSVKDPIILLASGSTGTSDTGIIMKRADGDSNVAVFYDEGVGLKIGHTLSTAQDIHISVDSSNSLSTSIYGPVTVAHSSAQALVVQGGAEIADDFKVGASKLFVDVSASNVGIGTDAPLATLDVHGTANVGALTVVSISGDGSGLSSIQSSNVSDFASNVTRIGTLETDLGSNVTRIGTLETDLGSNVTRIGTLETDLGSNVTRIGTLETDLGSNVTRIGTLETDLGSNVTRIGTLETDLGSNVTRIGTLETDLGSNVTRIGTLETDLGSNVTRIGTLETDLGSNVTRIGTLETDLGSNVTRIGTLETDLGSNVTRIGTLETDLGSNVTRITNLESSDMTIGGEKTFSSSLTVGGDVTVTDTTSGSAAGPEFSLYRNQTGTNGDYLGQLRFDGKHDGGNDQLYAKITGKIKKADQGGEDGVIETAIITDGSQRVSLRHTGDLFHIKNGTDLQVGETANLYVDTATSRVGVNTSSPAYTLDVHGTAAIVSEQPPAALTGDSTVVDGHGRYKVTSSGMLGSNYDYNIFSKNETDTWISLTNTFNVDGTHAGSESLGGVSGEWVKLEMPYKTTLRHFTLRHDIDNTTLGQRRQFPVDFKIVASNDDTNWQTLNTTTGVSTPEASDPALTFVVNASASYKFYAIVVEKITSGAAFNRCHIGELRLFTETFTVDAGKVNMTAASGLDVGYTEHPVEAFTGSTTYNANIGSNGEFQPSTHYVEGHGTYEAWASTQYNASGQDTREVWKLFDTGSDYWGSALTGAFETYNSSSPYEYVGTRDTTTTDVGGTRYKGVFVQLKMPYAITLAYTDIYRAIIANNPNRAPGAGVFFGSNDGEHWYKLTEFSGASYASDDKERITLNATTPYQYYRFVITNIVGGNSQTSTLFSQWRLFAEKPVTRMENVHISGQLSSETLQTGYIKWPRKSLKANESEGYVASASSEFSTTGDHSSWHAFEDKGEYTNSNKPTWASENATFSSGSAAVSRTTGSDTFNHEWLQIQLPQSIHLSYFNIIRRDVSSNRFHDTPKNGFMYGSNDGITWTKLVSYSDLTYTDYTPTRVDVNSATSYKYFRLAVTTTTYTSGAVAYTAINELQLFEAATGVGAAPTSAKLQVAGSLGMAKGSEFFAGDDVVMELPKHDRPLVKYPEVAMTAISSGGYTASASSTYDQTYEAWEAFNNIWHNNGNTNGSDTWLSENATNYNGTDGLYSKSPPRNLGTGALDGEWIKIEMPHKIKLDYITIYPRYQHSQRSPRDFIVYGSNDNVNWSAVLTETGASITSHHDETGHTFNVDVNDTYYKYFGLVTRKLRTSTAFVAIAELKLYGYEEGDTSVDVVHRSIPNKPGQQHLEVYWDANDSNSYSFADSSSVYDLSGSGATGTLTNGVGFDTEYNSFTFDGVNDIITVSNAGNGTGEWIHSSSVWFKRSSDTSQYAEAIWHLGTKSAGQASSLITIGDELALDIWSTRVRVVDFVKNDQWYHVCGVYRGGSWNSTNVDLYVNGVKIKTTVVDADTVNLQGTTLSIGGRDATTDLWHGSIANFRLYSKALNADQVRELYEYDAPRFGHRQNLVSLHKGNLGVGVAHPTFRFEVAGREDLQEYPPRALSQSNAIYTGFEEYIEGFGVFKVDSTSRYGSDRNTLQMFDKIKNGVWHGGTYDTVAPYAFVSGTPGVNYYTSFSTSSGVTGDWVQIELPHKILLKQNVISNSSQLARSAAKGYIVASNDGLTFNVLNTINDFGYTATYQEKTFITNTDTYYRIYRLLFTHKVGGDSATPLNMGEWRLFGTPAPSGLEDGHLTLGKALTAPRFTGHAAGAETPRAESLVVHYDTTVDSVASGTAVVDTSGNGINSTMQNGLVYSVSERALVFDGTDDRTYRSSIPNEAGAWVHSVSLWCKSNSGANDNSDTFFFIGEKSTYKSIALEIQSNENIRYYFWGSDADTPTGSFTRGVWHHVVVTYDGGSSTTSKSVYIDGVKQTVTQAAGTTALNATANDEFLLGCQQGGTKPLNGSISNFKIWGGVALTAEEVAAEYALGRTGKSLNVTDTAVCLGGTVPRAQLDVRGSALFGGDVGIGTTSPMNKLDVRSDNYATFGKATYNATGWSGIRLGTPYTTNHDAYCSVIESYNNHASDYNSDLRFKTSNGNNAAATERMRITAAGNVGIGTTSPGAKLDVNGVLKNLNPSWSLYFAGSPSPTTSGYLSFNNIKVSARNCTLNTSGGRTSRVTITVAGRYFIGFNGFTESNVSANTGVNYEIRINGTTLVRGYHVQPIANYSAMSGLGGLADLSVNDYVEINSTQQLHHNQNASFYGFMIG